MSCAGSTLGAAPKVPRANVHEVAAWRYVSLQALQAEIACAPETFTPWFKLAWARIPLAHAQVLGYDAYAVERDRAGRVVGFMPPGLTPSHCSGSFGAIR